jgi:hypothetical protein
MVPQQVGVQALGSVGDLLVGGHFLLILDFGLLGRLAIALGPNADSFNDDRDNRFLASSGGDHEFG